MLYAPILSPEPMHVPDGFLSVTVSIVMWVLSIAVIAIALRKTNQTLGEREVPLMGVLAAAIFAGQMLNFTVAGGTSGHLLGAALAVILLGPWAAVLVMTTVVSVQALLFQDGGILALGANIFNMAVIGVFVSYAVYTLLSRLFQNKRWGLFASSFSAAWASIFVAALAVALQLALSGTSPANLAIPAMALIHMLIGIGEGLITAGALAFVYAARKDLLKAGSTPVSGNRGVIIGGFVIAVLLAVLSPLASSNPDGLERVAEDLGFIRLAQSSLYNIIPDYSMPGISNTTFATIAAGVVGVIIVFGVSIGLGRVEKRT
jgi:cobalt/nickel transport system permease protein